jgi:hypothetical protein
MSKPKPFIHSEVHKPNPITASGSRAAIAVACWLLSSIGVLMSLLMFSSVSISLLFTQTLDMALRQTVFYFGLAVCFSWAALAVMTHGWIHNKKVGLFWVFGGALAGLVCAFGAFPASFICLPCMALGGYVFYFHLVFETPASDN